MEEPVPQVNNIIATKTGNSTQGHTYTFKKRFVFNVESKKLQYSLKGNRINDKVQRVIIKTYIHSLPWQYLYFYLTSKEFNDIKQTNHTARVKKVSIKLFNLGNRTPFVTSARTVAYANANSQSTIGVWENLESYGCIQQGTNITPDFLYGKPLKEWAPLGQSKDMPVDYPGCGSQGRTVDNRIDLIFDIKEKIETYDVPLNDGNFLSPPLLMQASVLLNATNSVGLIYEKNYTPKDGTFHSLNNAWHLEGLQPRSQGAPHQIEQVSGIISAVNVNRPTVISGLSYHEATVDNITYCSLGGTPGEQVGHSLGMGVVPLLNADNTLEKSVFGLMVETYIEIEAMSHGTNILMVNNNYPQPNTYHVSLLATKRTWKGAFGVAGKPVVALTHDIPEEPDDEDSSFITRETVGIRESGLGVRLRIKPAQIPGQNRITKKMSIPQRVQVFRNNLETRKTWIAEQREKGTSIEILETKNIQYAIPAKHETIPTDTDDFWLEISKVGLTPDEQNQLTHDWRNVFQGVGNPHSTEPVYI